MYDYTHTHTHTDQFCHFYQGLCVIPIPSTLQAVQDFIDLWSRGIAVTLKKVNKPRVRP